MKTEYQKDWQTGKKIQEKPLADGKTRGFQEYFRDVSLYPDYVALATEKPPCINRRTAPYLITFSENIMPDFFPHEVTAVYQSV